MLTLQKSVEAWGLPGFKEVLKTEIESLPGDLLPLQQALTQSSYAITDHFNTIILSISDDQAFMHIKAGVFYSGIIAGCNCADDPTPADKLSEYCEVMLDICKSTAQTKISLLD